MNRSKYSANLIMKALHNHSEGHGGYFTSVTGGMGSYKSGCLLFFAEYILNNYKKEKVFFSEAYDAPLQTLGKLPKNKVQLWIQKDSNVYFRDRSTGKEVDLGAKMFKGFHDLYRESKPGIVNVPFFGDRLKWMDFISFLREESNWDDVFVDEFSELCPAHQGGEPLKKIINFSSVCKDIRKCKMNVMFNTQNSTLIDYRINALVMCRIYLPGAVVSKIGRVKQNAVDCLLKGENGGNRAWVEMPGIFGLTQFKVYYEPKKGQDYDAKIRKLSN